MKLMHKNFAKTRFIGKPLYFLPNCHSTNDIASENAKNTSVKEGTLFYTDYQFKGRGQRGNTWESEHGKNITFSVVFRPDFLKVSDHFYLNIFTSLAIYDFLIEYIPEDLGIKWPNDIMWSMSKISGILIENSIRKGRFDYSVVGVGLNVNQQNFETRNAISMAKITSRKYDSEKTLEQLAGCMEIRYEQLRRLDIDNLYSDYIERLYWKDEVHVFRSDKIFNGIIRGINGSGKLMVETDHGINSYMFKEIEFIQ